MRGLIQGLIRSYKALRRPDIRRAGGRGPAQAARGRGALPGPRPPPPGGPALFGSEQNSSCKALIRPYEPYRALISIISKALYAL